MLNKDNIFVEYKDIITINELMELLNIGRNTAYNLVTSGEIKSIRIGNKHKIPKINVIDYLNRLAE